MAESSSVVVLRAGTRADVPGLVALGRAVVPPTYGPIDAVYAQRMLDEWWTVERFTDSLGRARFLVAEHDGEVVAMATVGRLSASHRDFPHVTGDREVMWKLYVHPDHQGLGLGRRLLAEVEAMVEGDELWLEVVDGNEQAFAFYRAQGFTEVEADKVLEKGMTAVAEGSAEIAKETDQPAAVQVAEEVHDEVADKVIAQVVETVQQQVSEAVRDQGGDMKDLQEKVEQIVMEKVAETVQQKADEVQQQSSAGTEEKKVIL